MTEHGSGDKPSRTLTDEQFIHRLVDAGWDREEATKAFQQDMDNAAEEDGYDGP